MNRRKFLAATMALAGSASYPTAGSCAQIARVHFEDRIQASDVPLKLAGTGLYYYKLFVKVAAAGLYVADRAAPRDVLSDVAKRLEMHYFRSVKAEDLVAGSAALLARNLSLEQQIAVQPRIDAMHMLYRNVAAGDRSSLTYVPDIGTSLALNGTMLGTVPGQDFAAAYFSIWFGEKPLDDGLKKQLLGWA